MIVENPTGISLGMSGEFFGKTYNVIGRALLGEMDYGRVYYWTEYYLETPGEEIVTLVYEETTLGVEWKWFAMFDPENPMTADEAATKKEGDLVTLDGVEAKVSLVRESKVYHTEGRAPQGVRPGANANYFNADSGTKLLVVSWTGAEMEFFRGTNLNGIVVAAAFKMRLADLAKYHTFPARSNFPTIRTAIFLLIVVVGLFCLMANDWPTAPAPPAVVRYNLPAPPLQAGSFGSLGGQDYRVEGHAEVEIAETGRVMIRHEYFLRDSDGNDALLVYGWKPGAKDWVLFTRLNAAASLTPQQAGSVRLGQTVTLDGVVVPISELFRSTVVRSEQLSEPGSRPGEVRYGFSGQSGTVYLLARWNENGLVLRKGRLLQEKDVTGLFAPTGK